MNKLEIDEIDTKSNGDRFHIFGYYVSVFDVSQDTSKKYKSATGKNEFEPNYIHVQYEVYFVDDYERHLHTVLVGFKGNIINETPEQESLMIEAGFCWE